jgi:hypothetical protein
MPAVARGAAASVDANGATEIADEATATAPASSLVETRRRRV